MLVIPMDRDRQRIVLSVVIAVVVHLVVFGLVESLRRPVDAAAPKRSIGVTTLLVSVAPVAESAADQTAGGLVTEDPHRRASTSASTPNAGASTRTPPTAEVSSPSVAEAEASPVAVPTSGAIPTPVVETPSDAQDDMGPAAQPGTAAGPPGGEESVLTSATKTENAATWKGDGRPSPTPPIHPDRRYVAPEYPERARRAGIEGTVVLEVAIDRRGRSNPKLIESSGSDVLDREAIRAAQLWRFTREFAGRRTMHRIEFILEESQ